MNRFPFLFPFRIISNIHKYIITEIVKSFLKLKVIVRKNNFFAKNKIVVNSNLPLDRPATLFYYPLPSHNKGYPLRASEKKLSLDPSLLNCLCFIFSLFATLRKIDSKKGFVINLASFKVGLDTRRSASDTLNVMRKLSGIHCHTLANERPALVN